MTVPRVYIDAVSVAINGPGTTRDGQRPAVSVPGYRCYGWGRGVAESPSLDACESCFLDVSWICKGRKSQWRGSSEISDEVNRGRRGRVICKRLVATLGVRVGVGGGGQIWGIFMVGGGGGILRSFQTPLAPQFHGLSVVAAACQKRRRRMKRDKDSWIAVSTGLL